jgi:hypothetical protein
VGTTPDDQWAKVEISDSLVGRRAGGSASDKARELRRASPLLAGLARLMGVHTDERAWRRGGAGERLTAWWLGRLPDAWHLLNDIPIGERGANIDHLIVGPGGVFTVNAKNLTGKVWIGASGIRLNGYRTDFVRKSLAEAERASRLLSAAVGKPIVARAVLAIIADDWTEKGSPEGVFVGPPRRVKDWLRQLPEQLSAREVILVMAAASKPETWRR